MKRSDIRSMGLAYLEVLEGKDAVNKHGHDHVGKEDGDVNNDKKFDSTDKYLLNRRKAISANIRKEEVELDEAGAFSYGAKVPRKGSIAYNAMMMRKQQEKNQKPIEPKDQMVGNAKVITKEEVELDELSTKTTDSYWKKATKQLDDPKLDPKTHNKRVSGVLTALNRDSKKTQTEEVEEVDEALTGNQHKIDANKNGKVDAHDFHLLRNKKTQRALSSAKAQAKPKSAVSLAKTPWNEEVELDEISANTLGKYSIKAAQQGNKRVAGQKMADDKVRKKYGYSSDAKVAAESVEEVSNASKVFNRIAAKAGGGEKGKKMAAGLLNKMKKEEVELDEVSANKLGKYSIAAAQQGGSDKRVAGQKMADEKMRKKSGYSSSAKVAAEATEWPIFARITEKLKLPSYKVSGIGDDPHEINVKYATDDKHTKGATKPEPMDSKASQGEKDFVAAQGGLKGNDSGISADKNADLNSKAVRTNMKQSPGRWNDQKIGDKTPPKASA